MTKDKIKTEGSIWMTIITIRHANTNDLAHIVHHYGPGDDPWDPFDDMIKLQRIPLEGLIIAEIDGKYAGFLYWFVGENPWFDPFVEKYGYITEVQVLENYRGQGVGKKLLVYALEQLKKKPIDAIYTATTEDNIVAKHLYDSNGFRPFSRTVHYKLNLK